MKPIRKPMRVADGFMVMEVLIAPTDTAKFREVWREDGATPMRRYGLDDLSPWPTRKGAIYQRHGLAPHVVEITDAGMKLLLEDMQADSFATKVRLSVEEFLGLQLARWLGERAPERGRPWQWEMRYLQYRIERTRHSKDEAHHKALRTLYADYQERAKPHNEVLFRDVLGKTVH